MTGATSSDNAGPVTITQALAGTVVGIGTHTITLTATDTAGNTNTATTTFTVVDARLTFSLSVSPAQVKRGKMAKLDVAYVNNTSERLWVSFTLRYSSPCGSFVLDNVGPVPINAGADHNANVNFHVPKYMYWTIHTDAGELCGRCVGWNYGCGTDGTTMSPLKSGPGSCRFNHSAR